MIRYSNAVFNWVVCGRLSYTPPPFTVLTLHQAGDERVRLTVE